MKYLRCNLPLPNAVKLTLSATDHTGGFAEDLLDHAIYNALTDHDEIDIRSGTVFQRRSEEGRKNLYNELERQIEILEKIVTDRDYVAGLIKPKARDTHYVDSVTDIRAQLAFHFRPGFLRFPEQLEYYPRYFRALRLRTERILSSPAKDQAKLEQVERFAERFDLALNAAADYVRAFDLRDFTLSLQEWRIAVFAPEVGTAGKITERLLSDQWDSLRL